MPTIIQKPGPMPAKPTPLLSIDLPDIAVSEKVPTASIAYLNQDQIAAKKKASGIAMVPNNNLVQIVQNYPALIENVNKQIARLQADQKRLAQLQAQSDTMTNQYLLAVNEVQSRKTTALASSIAVKVK